MQSGYGPERTGRGRVAWLEHSDGRVAVEERGGGRRLVTVHPAPGVFVSRQEFTTSYPLALIEQLLRVKAPSYLCDEIARDEDPKYVELFLRYSLLGYVTEDEFRGARMLDFGSGSGASTVVMARMFPETEIVGVELEQALIETARLRAQHYGLSNLAFIRSPTPDELPHELGTFRFINLGAVYEHLLPDERPRLLAQLWSLLELDGVFFVNQLPYRFYPIEAHTTGLPLLNYMPDRVAHAAARRWSKRVDRDASWLELLRDGIRGGTARSVRGDLLRHGGDARMLRPTMLGLRSHADLWYAYSSRARTHPLKVAMRLAFAGVSRLTGSPVAPGLSLAFQKLA